MIGAVGGGVAITSTLGVILNSLLSNLNETISKAGRVGNELLLKAGNEARRTVELAQAAFSENLNTALKDMDSKIQDVFSRLGQLNDRIVAGQSDVIEKATDDAQQLLNTLPNIGHVPQLRSVEPTFVMITDDPIQFTLRGNFPSDRESVPSLVFNGHSCQLLSNSNFQLVYSVPYSILFPATEAASKKIQFSPTGELKIPFKNGLLNPVKNEAIYKVFVRSLPNFPGSITFSYTTKHTRARKQIIETGRYGDLVNPKDRYNQDWHLCSCSTGDCMSKNGHQPTNHNYRGKNDDEERTFTATPTPGWSIIPGTSVCNLEVLQHNHAGPDLKRDDKDGVSYWVKTRHIVAGTSGSVNVNIRFTEQQEYTEDEAFSENVVLKWGESKTFAMLSFPDKVDCVPGKCTSSWKVVFENFKGQKNEFIQADATNPFLTLEKSAAGLTIKAPAGEDVKKIN